MSAALTDGLTNIELRLLEALGATARGPKRNGTFALWLVVRYCDGVLPPDALTPRIARKRFEQLQRRLTSLSLPAPLRRGVNGALRELRDERPDGIALALHQLVAPSNETLGDGAADALNRASRLAREITLQGEVTG